MFHGSPCLRLSRFFARADGILQIAGRIAFASAIKGSSRAALLAFSNSFRLPSLPFSNRSFDARVCLQNCALKTLPLRAEPQTRFLNDCPRLFPASPTY